MSKGPLAALLLTLISSLPLCGQVLPIEKPVGNFNLKAKTFGGSQFWADELLFHGWRIQRHVLTDHCRLLDGDEVRHAWGTFEHCHRTLQFIKQNRGLVPMSGKVVLVLHGLVDSRASMKEVAAYLREEGGYQALTVGYPSTHRKIEHHARSLARIIDNLPHVEEINFVAHSMGNLVIRHYLGDNTDEVTGRRPDQRIRRIVMLAPPNNGSEIARRMKDNAIFKLFWGEGGKQLANEWATLSKRLATPKCQFGIIAGGNLPIKNPLVQGDDDSTVSVAETRLPGARDFIVVPELHSFIMNDDDVQKYTLRFLQVGHFVTENKRQPIID